MLDGGARRANDAQDADRRDEPLLEPLRARVVDGLDLPLHPVLVEEAPSPHGRRPRLDHASTTANHAAQLASAAASGIQARRALLAIAAATMPITGKM